LGERLAAEEGAWADHRVVRKASDPIEPVGGLVALFGSLAPGGAILKRSAADKTLFEKEARAIVFSSLQDLSERVDDPHLDIQADDIMVLGPAEAPIAVVRGRHRFRILLKAPRSTDLQGFLRAMIDAAPPERGGVRVAIDVDPHSFL
jgi:hypothetical protein